MASKAALDLMLMAFNVCVASVLNGDLGMSWMTSLHSSNFPCSSLLKLRSRLQQGKSCVYHCCFVLSRLFGPCFQQPSTEIQRQVDCISLRVRVVVGVQHLLSEELAEGRLVDLLAELTHKPLQRRSTLLRFVEMEQLDDGFCVTSTGTFSISRVLFWVLLQHLQPLAN